MESAKETELGNMKMGQEDIIDYLAKRSVVYAEQAMSVDKQDKACVKWGSAEKD